jgi:hypothetical protein
MSGETEQSGSGWTVDTLKLHHDERIKAIEASQNKFEEAVASRFIQVNEFRGALDDLGKQMATRRELESLANQLSDLRSKIDIGPAALASLQSQSDATAGRREGMQLTAGLLFAGLAALGTVIGIIIIVANLATSR